MGCPKQLLPLDGFMLIEHVLRALQESKVDEIILVAGLLFDILTPISKRYGASIVRTTDLQGDMAGSIRIGLSAARVDASGILIFPADYPRVLPATIDHLLTAHMQNPQDIFVPVYQGHRGHPVIFPRSLLSLLDDDGTTLRDIMRLHQARVTPVLVDDAGILLDVDTPEVYAELIGKR
jgi:molybdenum cofactor cytidylyltransferase